jgi:glycosyltransferase involved in cell wall biosynthesis
MVYYSEGNIEQIKRLAKLVEVRKYTKPIKCDIFFSNYRCDIEVEAKEKYHIIHYDPLNVGFPTFYQEGWKYIGVSKVACKGFKEITGHDIELIYNPVVIDKPKVKKLEGLNLISATRLTSEKGLERIVKLSNKLDKEGVKYTWTIYTNKVFKARQQINSRNVIVKEQQLDLRKEVAESSYLVQLSSCESFGLSVCESLILGTPVIVTDLEAFHEIGVNDSNGIFIDLEMKNIPIDKMLKGKEKFSYTPPKDHWEKYLSKESNYNPDEIIKVKSLCRLHLQKEDLHLKPGHEAEVTKERASELECLGYVSVI